MSVSCKKRPRMYIREARIKAGHRSTAVAAMALHMSQEVVGRIERGETKVTPDDILSLAAAYGDESIVVHYCNNECPVGRAMTGDVQHMPFAQAALRIKNVIGEAVHCLDIISHISEDGKVSAWEQPDFLSAMLFLNNVFFDRYRDLLFVTVKDGYLKIADIKKAAPAPTGTAQNKNTCCNQYTPWRQIRQPVFYEPAAQVARLG